MSRGVRNEEPLQSQLAQLYNEYAVTKRLAYLTSVPSAYAIEGTECQPVSFLEYIQVQSLAELIRYRHLKPNT